LEGGRGIGSQGIIKGERSDLSPKRGGRYPREHGFRMDYREREKILQKA